MQVEILKKEEISKLKSILANDYGVDFSFSKFLVLKNENRLYLISKMFKKIEGQISPISFLSLGLFFGEIKKNQILLSLEGAQLIGKEAKRNIAILEDENSLRNFLLGFNILKANEIECQKDKFVLLKWNNEIVGVGLKKENYIENLTLKSGRLGQF